MRKYNSSIRTAFISEAGNQLRNNDYFGFVELDKFACYVIADGITGMGGAESAKSAISAAVDAFQREPGISRRKLKGYLRCANRELLQGKSYEKLKASVTVVVSDYVKFRYGQAGNTRLRLYRDGRCVQASRDMSLSQDLADGGQLLQDRVARHEERNNLTAWLGSGHFRPFISKKKKLCLQALNMRFLIKVKWFMRNKNFHSHFTVYFIRQKSTKNHPNLMRIVFT